jgi:hypothetical protein
MVLAIGHALRAREALSSSYALPGFLEVIHRLFKDGVFVRHDRSIRVGIVRSLDCFALSRERLRPHACMDGWVFLGCVVGSEHDLDGEVVKYERVPCRRCASEAGR